MAVKQTAGRDALGEFASKFAELNDDVLFGQVWSREDKLSLRDRSIVTVVALLAQGLTDSSFQYHLQSAKNNGVTKAEIAAKMHDADVLVFATPVYYYSVSGQLKTMLDRANPLFGTDYAFTKAYLLATAAEDEPETVEGTVKAVQGWVDCFDRCELAGTVFAGGVTNVGEIAGHPALEKAHQMGKEI